MSRDQRKDQIKDKLKVNRREFISKLGLVGAGLIVYSPPAISAASSLMSGVQTVAGSRRVIDIHLPATYIINEPSNWLDISLEKGPTIKVQFRAKGKTVLHKTKDPNVAAVELASLRLDSVKGEPLAKARLKTGVISVQVPNKTMIGTLNLNTGKLVERHFPLTISAQQLRTSVKTKFSPKAGIIQQLETRAAHKCNKKNDVHLSLDKLVTRGKVVTPRSSVFGQLIFGLSPNNSMG